ncbi:MAG: hypothetical protein ACI4WW_02675 [Candidatus Coprovivens sp.]
MENKTPLKLFEFLELIDIDCLDICDDIWDWGVGFCIPNIENKNDFDYYDKFIMLLAHNIEIIKYQKNWYSQCNITKFIMENLKAFTQFMEEENIDEYNPSKYLENEDEKDITDDNSIIIDVYLPTLESLIIGNYSNSDYEKIYNYLKRENSLLKDFKY